VLANSIESLSNAISKLRLHVKRLFLKGFFTAEITKITEKIFKKLCGFVFAIVTALIQRNIRTQEKLPKASTLL